MPEVLAICRNCGAVYGSGIVLENTRGAMITNCASSCPACGGMGEIPSGVYDAIGDVLTVAAASATSQEQLQRIIEILTAARERNAAPEEVVAEIEGESPELAETIRRLLIPRSAGDFYALIGLIVMALTLAKPSLLGSDQISGADAERLTERAVAAAIAQTAQQAGDGAAAATSRVRPVTTHPTSRGVHPKKKEHRSKRPGKTFGREKKHR